MMDLFIILLFAVYVALSIVELVLFAITVFIEDEDRRKAAEVMIVLFTGIPKLVIFLWLLWKIVSFIATYVPR